MKVDYNPYEGRQVTGVTDTVISRGRVIVDGGRFTGRAGAGSFIKRQGGRSLGRSRDTTRHRTRTAGMRHPRRALRDRGHAGAAGAGADRRVDGRWFKGNTHTHTLNSDGDSTPDDVVRWYREHGYHFLVLTDHNFLTEHRRAQRPPRRRGQVHRRSAAKKSPIELGD